MNMLENIDNLKNLTEDVRASLLHLVSAMEPEIQSALEALPEHDRALLVAYYRLDPADHRSDQHSPDAPKASRRSLQRARMRFNKALETRLEAELPKSHGLRSELEAALAIVRGGEVERTISDIESEVRHLARQVKTAL